MTSTLDEQIEAVRFTLRSWWPKETVVALRDAVATLEAPMSQKYYQLIEPQPLTLKADPNTTTAYIYPTGVDLPSEIKITVVAKPQSKLSIKRLALSLAMTGLGAILTRLLPHRPKH